MSVTLHFPSEQAIISYLENHRLTNDPYLKKKKIIEAVAKFFANEDKAPRGVDMAVLITMYELNTKLKIPSVGLLRIVDNLAAALKDCANGKKIEEKKQIITSRL